MSMNYSDYINAVSSVLEYPIANNTTANPFLDSAVNLWLPRAIEYAEQRIYRELDLLGTRTTDTAGFATPNVRKFTLPSTYGSFIVVEEVSVVYPISNGTPTLMTPTSKEFLDACWPGVSTFTPSVPAFWAPYDQASIYIGPAPDAAYNLDIVGTIRPTPLSSTNTTTPLTTYIPDVFLAASLISWTGFQRDYGQQSDDPKIAVSWETQYGLLKESAMVEQFRIKVKSEGWGTRIPNPVAKPPQT